jgi:hypothetical protein
MTKGELIKKLEGIPDSAIVLTGEQEGAWNEHVGEVKGVQACWYNAKDNWITYGIPHGGPAMKTPAVLIN